MHFTHNKASRSVPHNRKAAEESRKLSSIIQNRIFVVTIQLFFFHFESVYLCPQTAGVGNVRHKLKRRKLHQHYDRAVRAKRKWGRAEGEGGSRGRKRTVFFQTSNCLCVYVEVSPMEETKQKNRGIFLKMPRRMLPAMAQWSCESECQASGVMRRGELVESPMWLCDAKKGIQSKIPNINTQAFELHVVTDRISRKTRKINLCFSYLPFFRQWCIKSHIHIRSFQPLQGSRHLT